MKSENSNERRMSLSGHLKISNEMSDQEIEEILEKDSEDALNLINQGPEKKKAKTFNRLDEKFQWNSSLDDNHIFPEETEMVHQLRKEFGDEIGNWKDKTVLFFLLARRHNMTATRELIRKHIDKAKELGFDKHPPNFNDVKPVFKGANIVIKGAVDKHDRLLVYYRIGLDLPKNVPNIMKYKLLYWETFYRCDVEPIKYLRNGMVIVVDFSGFGWKNFDMSADAKEFYSSMTGLFPRRVRGMFIINGGAIVRLALKAGKLILSKKIMKRITILDKKSIKDLVPSKWLLTEYGGTLKMSFEDTVQEVIREDKVRDYACQIIPSINTSKTAAHSK